MTSVNIADSMKDTGIGYFIHARLTNITVCNNDVVNMGVCWNWQTGQTQNLLQRCVWVQVPLPLLGVYIQIFLFTLLCFI